MRGVVTDLVRKSRFPPAKRLLRIVVVRDTFLGYRCVLSLGRFVLDPEI